MSYWLAKYATSTAFPFMMIKRGVVDFAINTDWTPASGDVRISINGGSFAPASNLPTAIGGTGSAGWTITLTTAELTGHTILMQIVDSPTKAVEDNAFLIYTYGHASAKIAADLSDAVRLGLTALPANNAEALGGMFTRGTGVGQINQPANGQIDARIAALVADVITAAAIANGSIDAATFAAGAIDATAIAANAITNAKIAADAIGATQLAAGAIDRATFAADTGLQNIRSATAQAGSTTSTIVLDTGASAADDFYNNCYVYLVGGTGAGQVRRIRDYTGSSRTAAVARLWVTTPDNTSVFAIMPEASVWDEFAADHVTAATFGAIQGQSLTTSELLDNIVGPLATVVANGSNSASSFQIDVSTVSESAANWWNRAWFSFDGTAALAHQTKRILSFNQTTGFVTVEDGFTAIPTAGNTARIVTR